MTKKEDILYEAISEDTSIKKVRGFSTTYPSLCNLKLFQNIDGTWLTAQDDIGVSITIKMSDLNDFVHCENLDHNSRWKESEEKTTTEEAFEMAIKSLELKPCEDMGEISDGYHTFNELYHQRAVLFATIVNLNKDKAWKSFKHFDGKYCFDSNGDWFIVGIDTPEGSYTYHYSKEYWDMFNCKELECGKEWDGHTEKDVTRLLSLVKEPALDKISAEIENQEKWLTSAGYNAYNVDIAFNSLKLLVKESRDNE